MEKKIKKEFIESCQQELGYISGIFMSQGNTRAKDIIMPATELQEATDRFELYLFKALSQQKQEIIETFEGIKAMDRKSLSIDGIIDIIQHIEFWL